MSRRVSDSEWAALKASTRMHRDLDLAREAARSDQRRSHLASMASTGRAGIAVEDRLAVKLHELLRRRNRPIGI